MLCRGKGYMEMENIKQKEGEIVVRHSMKAVFLSERSFTLMKLGLYLGSNVQA